MLGMVVHAFGTRTWETETGRNWFSWGKKDNVQQCMTIRCTSRQLIGYGHSLWRTVQNIPVYSINSVTNHPWKIIACACIWVDLIVLPNMVVYQKSVILMFSTQKNINISVYAFINCLKKNIYIYTYIYVFIYTHIYVPWCAGKNIQNKQI